MVKIIFFDYLCILIIMLYYIFTVIWTISPMPQKNQKQSFEILNLLRCPLRKASERVSATFLTNPPKMLLNTYGTTD